MSLPSVAPPRAKYVERVLDERKRATPRPGRPSLATRAAGLVGHPAFGFVSISLIVSSTVCLTLDRSTFAWLDLAFALVFALELALRVVALGARASLRRGLMLLDALVVLVLLAAVALTSVFGEPWLGSLLHSARVLFLFRMVASLRAGSALGEVRLMLEAFSGQLAKVPSSLAIGAAVLLAFAAVGVDAFSSLSLRRGGLLPAADGATPLESNPFDNLREALVSVTELAGGVNVAQLMAALLQRRASEVAVLAFSLALVLCAGLIVGSLFVAIARSAFAESERAHSTRLDPLTLREDYRAFIGASLRWRGDARGGHTTARGQGGPSARASAAQLVGEGAEGRPFDGAVNLLLLLAVGVSACLHVDNAPSLGARLTASLDVLSLFCAVEMLAKLLLLGPLAVADSRWQLLDLGATALALLAVARAQPACVLCVRALRWLRLLRLGSPPIALEGAMHSLSGAVALLLLLLGLCVGFAVVGMRLFAGSGGEAEASEFVSFGSALRELVLLLLDTASAMPRLGSAGSGAFAAFVLAFLLLCKELALMLLVPIALRGLLRARASAQQHLPLAAPPGQARGRSASTVHPPGSGLVLATPRGPAGGGAEQFGTGKVSHSLSLQLRSLSSSAPTSLGRFGSLRQCLSLTDLTDLTDLGSARAPSRLLLRALARSLGMALSVVVLQWAWLGVLASVAVSWFGLHGAPAAARVGGPGLGGGEGWHEAPFSSLPSLWLSLASSSDLASWTPVMLSVEGSAAPDSARHLWTQAPLLLLALVAANVLLKIFVSRLLTAIVVWAFAEAAHGELTTQTQRTWAGMLHSTRAADVRLIARRLAPASEAAGVRASVAALCKSHAFQRAVAALALSNVALWVCLSLVAGAAAAAGPLRVLALALSVALALESALQLLLPGAILALGALPLWLELCTAAAMVLSMAAPETAHGLGLGLGPLPAACLLLLARLGPIVRAFRLARTHELLRALSSAAPELLRALALLLLVGVAFARLGVHLFWKVGLFLEVGAGKGQAAWEGGFQSMAGALLLLFEVALGSDWSQQMRRFALGPPGCTRACGNQWIALAFFSAFRLVVSHVLLNLPCAAILAAHARECDSLQWPVAPCQFAALAEAWLQTRAAHIARLAQTRRRAAGARATLSAALPLRLVPQVLQALAQCEARRLSAGPAGGGPHDVDMAASVGVASVAQRGLSLGIRWERCDLLELRVLLLGSAAPAHGRAASEHGVAAAALLELLVKRHATDLHLPAPAWQHWQGARAHATAWAYAAIVQAHYRGVVARRALRAGRKPRAAEAGPAPKLRVGAGAPGTSFRQLL